MKARYFIFIIMLIFVDILNAEGISQRQISNIINRFNNIEKAIDNNPHYVAQVIDYHIQQANRSKSTTKDLVEAILVCAMVKPHFKRDTNLPLILFGDNANYYILECEHLGNEIKDFKGDIKESILQYENRIIF